MSQLTIEDDGTSIERCTNCVQRTTGRPSCAALGGPSMSPCRVLPSAAILTKLGRGYYDCRRFRQEPLLGVLWGEEGFFNFVLKVVHAATGFNDPETRASYYRNVLELAQLDRELESPAGAVTSSRCFARDLLAKTPRFLPQGSPLGTAGCASCQPDGRGPCLCIASSAEIAWEVMLGVADLSDGCTGQWKAEKIIVQAPRPAGLETLEGLAIEVFQRILGDTSDYHLWLLDAHGVSPEECRDGAEGKVFDVSKAATPNAKATTRVVIEVRGGVADVAAPCGADECPDGVEVVVLDPDNECCPKCQSNDFTVDSTDSHCGSAKSQRVCGVCGATWDVDELTPKEPHALGDEFPACADCGKYHDGGECIRCGRHTCDHCQHATLDGPLCDNCFQTKISRDQVSQSPR